MHGPYTGRAQPVHRVAYDLPKGGRLTQRAVGFVKLRLMRAGCVCTPICGKSALIN
jgi:hypothetical protein